MLPVIMSFCPVVKLKWVTASPAELGRGVRHKSNVGLNYDLWYSPTKIVAQNLVLILWKLKNGVKENGKGTHILECT